MQVLDRAVSFFNPKVAALLAIAGAMASSAQAEAIDVAALVTDVSAQKTPIGTIGLAILGVVVAVAAFMWIRRVIK